MLKVNLSKEEIRQIFEVACAKRATLIFVTPYLRFESHFVHLNANEIHVRVSTGKGDAFNTLRSMDIKIRFPYKYNFLEAPANILGFGLHDGVKTLMLDMPKDLYENDDRKAFRLDRVGNIIVTLTTQLNEIITTSLMDISTTGAKLSSKGGQVNIKIGDKILMSIPLKVVTIHTGAMVRHLSAKAFGVEFMPKLPSPMLDPLSDWIFKKQEEAKGKLGEGETEGTPGEVEEGKVLVVTSDEDLEKTLRKLLVDERLVFFHSEPNQASLDIMLAKMPHMVILHLPSDSAPAKQRMKTLAAMVPVDVPMLLLGTDIDSGELFELGKEWRAASSIAWAKERWILAQRLVVGMVRKHFGGETPMAPKEL